MCNLAYICFLMTFSCRMKADNFSFTISSFFTHENFYNAYNFSCLFVYYFIKSIPNTKSLNNFLKVLTGNNYIFRIKTQHHSSITSSINLPNTTIFFPSVHLSSPLPSNDPLPTLLPPLHPIHHNLFEALNLS